MIELCRCPGFCAKLDSREKDLVASRLSIFLCGFQFFFGYRSVGKGETPMKLMSSLHLPCRDANHCQPSALRAESSPFRRAEAGGIPLSREEFQSSGGGTRGKRLGLHHSSPFNGLVLSETLQENSIFQGKIDGVSWIGLPEKTNPLRLGFRKISASSRPLAMPTSFLQPRCGVSATSWKTSSGQCRSRAACGLGQNQAMLKWWFSKSWGYPVPIIQFEYEPLIHLC